MSISICMIVKNEEKFIECAVRSAQSVMGITDVVVVDTGSTDRTREIAQSCGARVFDFEWIDDFSAARNFASEQAENDLIFFLDADEEIIEADMPKVLKAATGSSVIGIASMVELADDTVHNASRLYNRKGHFFTGSIHENLTPKGGITPKRVNIPIVMNHRGYLPELQQERGKFERNVKMLEKELEKNPNDPYYLFQLGKCYFIFDRDLEQACKYFEKALRKCRQKDVHREYVYNTVECYGYALINTGRYSEAMSLLKTYYPHYKTNPNFRFLAGHIYRDNGMFIEAVESYESCIGADMFDTKGITSYLSYYNIGVILECIEMFEDAAEMYKSCGDYEPALVRLKELRGK